LIRTDTVVCVAVKLEADETGARVCAVRVVTRVNTADVLVFTLVVICWQSYCPTELILFTYLRIIHTLTPV